MYMRQQTWRLFKKMSLYLRTRATYNDNCVFALHKSPKELSEGLQPRIVCLHKAVKVTRLKIDYLEKKKGHYIWHGKDTGHLGLLCCIRAISQLAIIEGEMDS